MKKPFLIVNIVEGELGVIHERPTWKQAVDFAVKLAAEQCDSKPDDIRKELEKDSDFLSIGGDIRVCICQTEND